MADEEDTLSMAELVWVIDTHVESVDLEVTSSLDALENVPVKPPLTNQPSEKVPAQQTDDVVLVPLIDHEV